MMMFSRSRASPLAVRVKLCEPIQDLARLEKEDVVRLLSYQSESSGLCDSQATGNVVAYKISPNRSKK